VSLSVFRDILPSGLTVVSIETPHLHSVMCAVYVRVGSRHEDERNNGVSHMLEHLFFRGSHQFPDSVRMNAAVEAQGGNLNGVTMRDSSYFYTPTHADGLEVSLDILGDMLTQPKLTHLATEKRIVLEEMLDEVDDRGRDVDVDNLTKRVLYKKHPLSLKIAGTAESVKGLTMREVHRHFSKAYVGGNMVVAVAGPVRRRRVLKAVKSAFRHLRPGPRLMEEPPKALSAQAPRFKFVSLDEPQVEFRLSFPTVAEDDPDAAGLGLLRRVLDDGLSSRLPHNIVERRGLAYSVGAMIESFHDAGTFEIDGASTPANLSLVFEEMLRTVGTLRAGKITAEELSRAKTRFALHLDFLQDSPGELCGWFGGMELYRPADSFAAKKLEIKDITVRDLKALAQRWLGPERLVAVAVGPKAAKKKAEAVIKRAAHWLR
jgi:predicted Zn-dependent peptidase